VTYYCTLFDTFYLSRGIAMYESLRSHTRDFHLFIFAFDSLSVELLHKENLKFATIITLEEFETDELKEVKKGRSIAEYCWTCTPSTISYVLNNYDVQQCTYIDSDLFFYSDPSILIREMEENGKNVLITEHRFSPLPKFFEKKRAGRFCVQFITFVKEKNSLTVLELWRKQCIDWCYARYEDGKFGDQKYLDNWPDTYPNVHILKHPGGGIAPWNLTQYLFTGFPDPVRGCIRSDGSEFDVIFYHFQYVKFHNNGKCDIGWYFISSENRSLFYTPYLDRIAIIENRLKTINVRYKTGITFYNTGSLKNYLKTLFKKVFQYNIIDSHQ
jgi:hypothetical protein